MGLDDLIRILLFAAFFWPLLSGLFKKRQPQRKPQQTAPPRPKQPETREPRRQPSAERPASGVPNPTVAGPQSTTASNFDKRLEEARKRVREAMASSEVDTRSARPQQRTTTAKVPTSQQGAERGLFREPAQQTLLSRPKQAAPRQVDVQQLESAPRTFAPSNTPKGSMANTMGKTSFGEESDPLKVTRLRRRGRFTSRSRRATQAAPLLDMSDTSILRGFVWKQILSEPKAKSNKSKATRRTP